MMKRYLSFILIYAMPYTNTMQYFKNFVAKGDKILNFFDKFQPHIKIPRSNAQDEILYSQGSLSNTLEEELEKYNLSFDKIKENPEILFSNPTISEITLRALGRTYPNIGRTLVWATGDKTYSPIISPPATRPIPLDPILYSSRPPTLIIGKTCRSEQSFKISPATLSIKQPPVPSLIGSISHK